MSNVAKVVCMAVLLVAPISFAYAETCKNEYFDGDEAMCGGDYAIPGTCGSPAVELSPGGELGSAMWYFEIKESNDNVDEITYVKLFFDYEERGWWPSDLPVALYDYIDYEWDFYWSLSAGDTYHEIPLSASHRQRYINPTTGRIMWMVHAPGENNTCIHATMIYYCYTEKVPLPPPLYVSPQDGALDQMQPVYLDWGTISGADYYQVQVDNNSNFGSPEKDAQTSSSYYNASGLADGTKYWWRVRAHNEYSWGSWNSGTWDFTTSCSVLGVPPYLSPSDGVTNQTQPIILDWSSLTGADYYQVQVDNNSNFSSPEKDAQPSSSYYSVSGLADGTRFWWRVRAHNSCGWGSWNSGTWDFTTSCPPLGTPSYVSPSDGATNKSQPVFLDWGSVSGADKYRIQVDNNSSFYAPEIDVQPTTSYYNASGLADGTRYWWRVRAYDNTCGWGAWNSGTWDFTTSCPPPGTPSYVSPSDGATNQSQPVYLDWSSVSGADKYQVQVDNNSSFSSPEKDAQPTSSYYNISGLANGTKYWWRVRAYDNTCGWGSWNSGTWDFTTSCPPPGTPSYVSPSDGATNKSQPVYLDWSGVSGANKYRIQVDDNSSFSAPEIDAQPTSSYYNTSGLADGTKYWWRVRAYDNTCGWGNWNSGTWDFTTSCPPPGTPSYVSPSDGAKDLEQPVYLDWSGVSGANKYRIQVDDNSSFSSPEIDAQPTSSYYNASGLADGTKYWWRVRAYDNTCGWGNWNSGTWDFTTSCPPPGTPSYVSPSDGAKDLEQPFPLDWDNVVGADKYQVQVADNSNFSWPEIDSESSSSDYMVHSLAADMRYWWRVRAHNSCDWGSWNSGERDFTAAPPTAVDEIPSSTLPDNYSLSQNYPNPFNPETRIEFALPTRSYVTIDVYDIVGRRIRNLASEQLSAGRKVITWDGRDDNGQLVSSGVYFYRLEAGDFVESRKMVLLK